MMMKRISGNEKLFRAVLTLGAFVGAVVGTAGCGGTVVHERVVVHENAPAAETETVEEAPPTETVIETTVEEPDRPVVVERVIEPVYDNADESVIYIDIERHYGRSHAHFPRLRGAAIVNFNTGYLDGWAGADFFNHGRPLTDAQVDRMIEMGRRQGDPTGKLALAGYQEGYRAGAHRQRNPYARRMTAEQQARFRTLLGQQQSAPSNETYVREESPEAKARREAARNARVETSRNNLETARAKRDAEQARRDAEAKKLELARLEKEKARKAQLDAARQDRKERIEDRREEREQKELAFKAKLEADRKAREAEAQQRKQEREQRELALKNKLEAEKKERDARRQQTQFAVQQKKAEREAQEKAEKQQRQAQRDQRHAELEKKRDERKQRLAEKKAEREAKKTETADVSEPTTK